MQNIKEIKKKIKYEKNVMDQFKNSEGDTIASYRYMIAETIVNVLEWVIEDGIS